MNRTQQENSRPVRRLNTKGKIAAGLSFVFFLAGFIWLIHCLFYAKQPADSYTFELGEEISEDAADYMDAGFFARHLALADFSLVDKTRPGKYPMCIVYFGKVFSYDIIIRDTMVPEITLKEGPFYFLPGTHIEPSDFIESVKDADRILNITFDTDLMDTDSFFCRDLRTYTARIMVEDSSGNTSIAITDFLVDEAPKLTGVKDFYISNEADADLLEYVKAIDYLDGDLTDSIEITFDPEQIPEEGVIDVSFTVTDSCGFTSSETVKAYFDSPDAIQQLIGSRSIVRDDYNIIGAYNAYDTGLFEGQNTPQTLADVMPSVVHIKINKDDGSCTIGSGFIAEITDNEIYVITNGHVVGRYAEAEVYFGTGDTATGNIVGCAEEYDVAVIKIPLNRLPDSIEDKLYTVHIDMTYWEEMDEDTVNLGILVLDENGEIEHVTYGTLVETLTFFPFFEPHVETEMALPLKPGDSGSAVFDSEGRLIAMAFAYSIAPERDWAVPLNEIVRAYTEITGRNLYTY